jgi:hypothetical protein
MLTFPGCLTCYLCPIVFFPDAQPSELPPYAFAFATSISGVVSIAQSTPAGRGLLLFFAGDCSSAWNGV